MLKILPESPLPEKTAWFLKCWQMSAESLAMFYGGHVYLVGSALTSKTPNDFDIRIPLAEDDMLRLFGDATDLAGETRMNSRLFRQYVEELKLSRRHSRWSSYQWRLDIQFQPKASFEANPKRKILIDRVPDWALEVGRSDP